MMRTARINNGVAVELVRIELQRVKSRDTSRVAEVARQVGSVVDIEAAASQQTQVMTPDLPLPQTPTAIQ